MPLPRRGRAATRSADAPVFEDRLEAGHRLGACLTGLDGRVMVLGIDRGGVQVAMGVANHLGAALDVVFVEKLAVPGRDGIDMGALAHPNVALLDQTTITRLGIDHHAVTAELMRGRRRLDDRDRRVRGDRPAASLAGRTVVLTDAASITGTTMSVALSAVRRGDPARLIAAVPIASTRALDRIARGADEVVTMFVDDRIGGLERWYRRFDVLPDDEEIARLRLGSGDHRPARRSPPDAGPDDLRPQGGDH